MKSLDFVLLRAPSQSLKDLYRFPRRLPMFFKEALQLASPDFFAQYANKNSLADQDREKLDLSLKKYWIRSCSRCTPYGLFAGVFCADISKDKTELTLMPSDKHAISIRLDMAFLALLVDFCEHIPEVRKKILFFPNSSIYTTPMDFRYVEYDLSEGLKKYKLSSVERTLCLDEIYKKSSAGCKIDVLIKLIASLEDVSIDDATQFVDLLIDSQFLVSNLSGRITDENSLMRLAQTLEDVCPSTDIHNKIIDFLTITQHCSLGNLEMKAIYDKAGELNLTQKKIKNILQVDLFLTTKRANINKVLIDRIISQVERLSCLSRNYANGNIEAFKRRFTSRYEAEYIPLSIALDPDLGVGYLDQGRSGYNSQDEWFTNFPLKTNNEQRSYYSDHLTALSMRKYEQLLKNRQDYIEIMDSDIQQIEQISVANNFPCSMYIMGTLLSSEYRIDNHLFDLTAVGGPSSINLIGRFLHGDEKLKSKAIEAILEEEKESEDSIYAEIIHLPEDRVGNILLRPVLRKYEIPYLGTSSVAADFQINIQDLYVSVSNNQVVLYSKKHKRRIVPRLTSAHNYGNRNLPLYQFLCDLQNQGNSMHVLWDWGALSGLNFLPRVTYKNLVIKKARWIIYIKDLFDMPKDSKKHYDYFKKIFLKRHKLPNQVGYMEGDNILIIDLKKREGVKLFVDYLYKKKEISLQETLLTEENCIIRDSLNRPYTNEVIIPVKLKANNNKVNAKVGDLTRKESNRSFIPGSEWLYYKVYCGSKTAEEVLVNVLLKLINKQLKLGNFERFFFVRFYDDFEHLRIRFFNRNKKLLHKFHKIFITSLENYIDAGRISKITIDTYIRENERYGPGLIEEVEELFFYDSLAQLDILYNLQGENNELRIYLALHNVNRYLDDFNLSIEQKTALLRNISNQFFEEFGGHPMLRKYLNGRYRKYKEKIVKSLSNEENKLFDITTLKDRSKNNHQVIESILKKVSQDPLTINLYNLIQSILHMSINRLFTTQQRKYELIIYSLLERYYSSLLHKAKTL